MNACIALIIAAQGYQPVEYAVPKKIFEQEGWKVITVSNKSGIATAADGSTTQVDVTLDKLDVEQFQAIIFIGGPGALENLDSPATYQIAQQAAQAGKIIGGICISPRILAKSGILANKKATGWDDDNKLADIFKLQQVVYERQPVVTDGNIVTAVGPHAAREFAAAIVRLGKTPQTHEKHT